MVQIQIDLIRLFRDGKTVPPNKVNDAYFGLIQQATH